MPPRIRAARLRNPFAAGLAGNLFAVDAASGARLWHDDVGQPIGGDIISYRAGGEQFVAVAAGVKGAAWPVPITRSCIVIYALK